jgi:hypothetical protein
MAPELSPFFVDTARSDWQELFKFELCCFAVGAAAGATGASARALCMQRVRKGQRAGHKVGGTERREAPASTPKNAQKYIEPIFGSKNIWTLGESNPRPPAC